MKKRTIISIAICLAAIIVVMTMLYWTSPLSEELEPSGFTRKFTSAAVTQKNVLELDNKNPYIAGIDENNIYLGDYHKPFFLVKCDSALTESEEITLKMHGVDSVKSAVEFRTVVDSPHFYLANGVMPIITKGNIKSWVAEPVMHSKENYFTDMLPITNSSFAIRSFSAFQDGLQMARLNTADTPNFKFNLNLLTHQQDGIFSVYGYILPYKIKNKFIYVYAYRNQYLIVDSTLENYQTYQTIDTFSVAPIKVGSYSNNTEHTLSSPPNIINGPSCISGKYLYINSKLLANNENKNVFTNSNTIDVYDLEKGQYEFSFHIPNFEKQELSEFRTLKNKIYCIYKNKIVLFEIHTNKPTTTQ